MPGPFFAHMMVQVNIGFYMPDIQTISGMFPIPAISAKGGKLEEANVGYVWFREVVAVRFPRDSTAYRKKALEKGE
jgi:hypothetical protein